MNRLPEEARCKNCPHWERWNSTSSRGTCKDITNDSEWNATALYMNAYSGEGMQFISGEDSGCSRHPHWSKEE